MPTAANAANARATLPFEFRADEERMHLYLDRVANVPVGDVSVQTVTDEMARRHCLIDEDTAATIARTIAAWQADGEDPSGVLIARGRPPTHGRDGRVEWTDQCDPTRKRGLRDDGNVSHYESNLVALRAGDVICTFHWPTRGDPGVNVLSQELPARNGTAVSYRAVAGCHVEEDTGRVIADIDGLLDASNGEIRVTEGLHLRGNVDFKTGHVSAPGSIQIDGSVVDLFRVDAGANAVVRGDVRLAHVRCGGDLEVGGTVATADKGACLAGGDVRLRMVDGSTVAAWGDIHVAKEAISTALFAGKSILAPHATISGGVVVGRGGVQARTLGSDGQTRTLVLAGVDWSVERLTQPVLAEAAKLKEALEKRIPALNTLRANLKRLTHAQREQVVELEFEAQAQQDDIDSKIAFVEAARAKSREESHAVVEVTAEVHPGVELRLGNRLTKITKLMTGPLTFRLVDRGQGLELVAQTGGGNTIGLRTGRIADPLLNISLPDLPPEGKQET